MGETSRLLALLLSKHLLCVFQQKNLSQNEVSADDCAAGSCCPDVCQRGVCAQRPAVRVWIQRAAPALWKRILPGNAPCLQLQLPHRIRTSRLHLPLVNCVWLMDGPPYKSNDLQLKE